MTAATTYQPTTKSISGLGAGLPAPRPLRVFRGRAIRLFGGLFLAVMLVLVGAAATGPGHRALSARLPGAAYRTLAAVQTQWFRVRLGHRPTVTAEGFRVLLPRDGSVVHDPWGRPVSGPDFGLQARWVAAAARKAMSSLAAVTGVEALRGDVESHLPDLVIYASVEAMSAAWGWPTGRAAVAAYWPGTVQIVAPSAWLLCDSDGPLGAGGHSLLATVGHELTHWHLDRLSFGRLPRWLSEGLAQRTEERLVGAESALALIRQRAVAAGPAGIRDITSWLDVGGAGADDERRAYTLARSFVGYLDDMYAQGWEQRLVNALRKGYRVGGGEEQDAFVKAVGAGLSQLESEWLAWLSSREDSR